MFETLGLYKILERIGAGGMGEVYRARDTRLGRTVAIKVLPPAVATDPERRARFLQDARAAAALSHPNIAALYEIGEDQDQLFLVFEFVPGETLKQTIAGRPLNPRRAIDLAVQLADAIADAHAAGVVHGDIRAATVHVTPKGNAKLLEFGLSAWTAGGAARAQAATLPTAADESALATTAYLSPEQALGECVDHRTDIFSLGILLFEMLTGRLPFTGATSTDLALQIVQAAAPAPSAINKALPPELDAIVGKALAKSLDQRYESAAALAAELRSVGAILDVRSDIQEAAAVSLPSPDGRRGIGGWLVLLSLLAAAGAAAWYERADIQKIWRRTIGPPPAAVIAVMPFDADSGQTFFADGFVEDLITRLGQTPGLKVVGRSTAPQFRGRPARDAARELGAAVALTGSVRPSGDGLKVSLQLIDPADGAAIWSQQYSRDAKDVFALQAQAAADIAQALRVAPQPTPSSARAASRQVDPHGYELYVRGRQAAAQHALPDAIASYEQAVAADAGLGEAFAEIVESLNAQPVPASAADQIARRERMLTAAKRAYELDPDLPRANIAMGLASDALGDALKYLRRAIELDPSDGEAYQIIGEAIDGFDRERAAAFMRKARELEPRPALKGAAPAVPSPACETEVVNAAHELERKNAAAAHRLADGALTAASLDQAGPAVVRCGLHAAAALQSPGQAAALLDRIAVSESMLRGFALTVDGQSGSAAIEGGTYPWSLIARDPIVAEAKQRLDAAYAREREVAAAALKGLP